MDRGLMNLEEDFHRVVFAAIHLRAVLLLLLLLTIDTRIEGLRRDTIVARPRRHDIGAKDPPIIFEGHHPSADRRHRHAPERTEAFRFDPTKKSETGSWRGDENDWRDHPSLISRPLRNSLPPMPI